MIRKTAVMEIIKAHMDGEDKNTKAVLSDVMYSVNELETLEQEPCDDAISRADRLLDLANAIESDDSGYWTNKRISFALRNISSVTQKSNITWVTGADGAKIALKNVPVWKAIKICEILGAPQESEEQG